jgi:hypothetical protein
MTRSVSGQGTSLLFLDNQGAANRATTQAAAVLERTLEASCDPVPCPSCGWYQQPMVLLLRRRHHRWLFTTGVALLTLAAILFLVANVGSSMNEHQPGTVPTGLLWAIMATAVVLSPGLILFRCYLARRYEPNQGDAEARKRLGQARTIRPEEYLQILQDERERRQRELREGMSRLGIEGHQEQRPGSFSSAEALPRQSPVAAQEEPPPFERRDYLDSLREKRRAKQLRKQQGALEQPQPPEDAAPGS